uniref:Retinol binding protein 1 n=1 Tax=Sus scrofa TaxID=9823 RepID=A0A8D1UYT9_PIG
WAWFAHFCFQSVSIKAENFLGEKKNERKGKGTDQRRDSAKEAGNPNGYFGGDGGAFLGSSSLGNSSLNFLANSLPLSAPAPSADVNVALRKIANLLKPDKEIVQDGNHMIIRTLSTFRNYIMDFEVGKEFEEDLTGIDDRKCMTTVSWDGDKLECVQKGEKEGRGWTQWIEGDELHLEMRVQGVVCKQVFKKVN